MDILVPCKVFAVAKSRLAPRLGPEARLRLSVWLLRHTLSKSLALTSAGHVHLITGDADAAAIGREHGVHVIPDEGAGLNAAISRGRDAVVAGGGRPVILPIDLPLATAQAIGAAAATDADVVVAPDMRREGTNLLCLSAKAAPGFVFSFGPDSLTTHRAEAEARGHSLAVVDDPRLAFDIDQPADFDAWQAMEDFPWTRETWAG